ncbi:MFS transporter [soil metagenome]
MRSFVIFLLAYTLSQFYRSFLAVIAPELAHELALTPQNLANMQALWIAGFVLAQFPIGWTLDTVGPRFTVGGLMISAVAGAALFASAQSVWALDIAMLLIGIGCAPIYMGALYIFGRMNRPEQFALLSSWLLGIGSVGNLLAATPLAYAASAYGWRTAMLAIGVATALSALVIVLLVRNPPRLVHGHSPAITAVFAVLFSTRSLWFLLPITLLSYGVVIAERGLWAGPYLSEVQGLDAIGRGNALLVMAASMSAGAFVFGPLDRLLSTRKWIVFAASLVVSALFIVLGSTQPGPFAATLILACIGGFGMSYGVLMAHGRAFFPDHLLGRGITLLNVFFIGGAGLLQPVSGWAVTAMKASGTSDIDAYGAIHIGFGLVLAVATVLYLFARDRPPGVRE